MERFTVIIPTLDRCETLAHTLETCISQKDDHFQILVSDNLSTDGTRDIIGDFARRDPRVRAIRPPKRLGMATHFEFALEHAAEGFVMLLGSDDGLLPHALRDTRRSLANHPEAKALHCGYRAQYFYPTHYGWQGSLQLRLIESPETVALSERLRSVVQADEMPWSLPYPYNFAWVHTSVLDTIKAKSGRRIHSPVPDVFLSIAVASQLQDHEMVSCPPFSILGLSSNSTGGSVTDPRGSASVMKAFTAGNEVEFHPQIKYTRSIDLITLECLLHARDCGLLPRDLPIPWEKRIARTLVDVHAAPWGEAQRDAILQELQEQAVLAGCEHIMADAAKHSSMDEWKKTLPYNLSWLDRDWDFVLDTRPMGVTGVHEAARIAGDLFEAISEGTSPRPVDLSSSADVRAAALSVLAKSYVEARASWFAVDKEMWRQSEHAANLSHQLSKRKTALEETTAALKLARTELAKKKKELAGTKQKLADAKSSIAQRKVKRSIRTRLSKWFRA